MHPLTTQKIAALDAQDRVLAQNLTNGTVARYEQFCDHCQQVSYPVRSRSPGVRIFWTDLDPVYWKFRLATMHVLPDR